MVAVTVVVMAVETVVVMVVEAMEEVEVNENTSTVFRVF
jgi:hypothetical protein